MSQVNHHSFQTRFLNHLISFLDSSRAAESKSSFKLYMHGQLGKYGKEEYREARASRPIKQLKDSDVEDAEERFLKAIEFSLILLKSQGYDKVASNLVSRIKEKEKNLNNFSVRDDIETLIDSFQKLNLKSNIDEASYFVYARKDGNWSRVLEHQGEVEIELPASDYRIKCMKSRKFINEEINLESDSKLVFSFEEELKEEEKENPILSRINPF